MTDTNTTIFRQKCRIKQYYTKFMEVSFDNIRKKKPTKEQKSNGHSTKGEHHVKDRCLNNEQEGLNYGKRNE